uniref:OTU domain-containing protein n=1 Tax=Acrobeloides nanus TaxID=290746 RepID=A0A914D4P8_9BILA
MSDSELSPLDQLKSKHNKEKKDLQAKITSLKHSIPKNDKKKKKEIMSTIEQMEGDLKAKHEVELKEFHSSLASLTISSNDSEVKTPSEQTTNNEQPINVEKRPTKAQKRREKKGQEMRRREEAALYDEQNAVFSQGKLETNAITQILQERSLRLVEIAPDGDCMYNALAYQINMELIVPV